MSGLAGKIGLGIRTFGESYLSIGRQFEPEKITKIQNRKLRKLIRYCFENIKYYREEFERSGIRPEQIESTRDLQKIPILTKEQLRERFWDFLPRQLPPCRISRTSGSTGEPVCILSDNNSRMYNSAAVIRYRQAWGIGLIGTPILTPLKTVNDLYNKKPHWTFLQGIHKTFYINPYIDSPENIEYAAKLLKKIKNPALIGITPAVRALAYRIKDGLFPEFRPSAVLTTGESLNLQVRALLEYVFTTKVADIYSCTEAGDVAWECRRGAGYHINADNVIVEIVNENGPVEAGQIGEVVITNLNRYAMPIIRFKNGDLARLANADCSCGCKLPMIAEILGRSGEDITLPDGRIIPWNQLKSQMNHPWVRQFQLIQNQDGSLTIQYVSETGINIEQIDALLLSRFKNLLGSSIKIQIVRTNKIQQAPSGKTKLVISDYKPPRADSPTLSKIK